MTKEPSIGLLMSMAIRYDHALGAPGYYDQAIFGGRVSHAERLASTIVQMRQIYEEVSGHGFYSPEKECYYASLYEASK